MIAIDIVNLVAIAVGLIGGASFGFGKSLKFFTSGIFGKIISVVICYFIFGLVVSIPFVQNLLGNFVSMLTAKGNFFCNLLVKIRIDLIVFAVVLFFAVQICRVIIVSSLQKVMEADNKALKALNKFLGAIFVLCVFAIIELIIMQIIAWIDGVDGNVANKISNSVLGLGKIFKDNPLNKLISHINLNKLTK